MRAVLLAMLLVCVENAVAHPTYEEGRWLPLAKGGGLGCPSVAPLPAWSAIDNWVVRAGRLPSDVMTFLTGIHILLLDDLDAILNDMDDVTLSARVL